MVSHQSWSLKRRHLLWILPALYMGIPWLLAISWPWFRLRLGEEIWVHRASRETVSLSPCALNQWTASFTERIEHGEPNHEKSITEVLSEKRASCDQMAWILQRVALEAGYKVWTLDICPTIHQMVFVSNPVSGAWILDPYESVRLADFDQHGWTCRPVKRLQDLPPIPKAFPFARRPFCYALVRIQASLKMKAWRLLMNAYGWWFYFDLDSLYLRWFTDLPIPRV